MHAKIPLLTDNLFVQPFCTALLYSLIEQPYWTTLFHISDLICVYLHIVDMNLFQLMRILHNVGISRNQNAWYLGNRCTASYLVFLWCITELSEMDSSTYVVYSKLVFLLKNKKRIIKSYMFEFRSGWKDSYINWG